MSEITVTPIDDRHFAVELRVGAATTRHRVAVPPTMVDDLGLTGVDPVLLVRESMAFLLEREPATSILSEFALSDIPRYFDEYHDELFRRMGAG